MSKRRRKKRRDEDKLLTTRQAEEESSAASLVESEQLLGMEPGNESARPLQQQAVLQMQQEVGNATVQRMLQRKIDPESAAEEVSQKADNLEPYEFKTNVNLREGGELDLDLRPALDLKRLGIDAESDLIHAIKRWQGIGSVALSGFEHLLSDLKMTTDGRLNLKLGSGFIAHLAALVNDRAPKDEESVNELERAALYGRLEAEVTASLHYSAADPEIQDAELDNKSKLFGADDQKQGLYLLLEFETTNFGDINDAFFEELNGLFLLEAVFSV